MTGVHNDLRILRRRRDRRLPAQEPQPLTIGETVTLEALGSERAVNIILPADYAAEPDKRWPVIYQLDGAISQT